MNDIFISYAHVDNESLTEGQKGWISQFHRTLEIRLRQLLGENPRIWRDMKLSGTDIFDETIVSQFENTKLMISVVSPRYVNSEWCARELNEFYNKVESSGGVRVGDKSRIIKVVKTPVDGDSDGGSVHKIFNSLLGFEFFDVDPDTGRVREYNEEFGHEAKRNYLERVYDLAHEITTILKQMRGGALPEQATAGRTGRVVYLAEVTSELKPERDRIRRELLERGHTVLPDRPLPLEAGAAGQLITDSLAKAHLAIHLIGGRYGVVPEGGETSMIEMQSRLSSRLSEEQGLQRLVWLPSDNQSDSERHSEFIRSIQNSSEGMATTELLTGQIEEVKNLALKRLKPDEQQAGTKSPALGQVQEDGETRIYLICDQQDEEEIEPLEDYLFDQGYEVKTPQFDGDEDAFVQAHQDNLRFCDGVLIYFGNTSGQWVDMKLMDLLKAPGYGRVKPLTAKAVYVGPPENRRKTRFRTRTAEVIQGGESINPDELKPFLAKMKQPKGASA
ncbi:MAG: toll/interleukin-1 receptor domain-containing protein [Verrucomicrobia bacterium]|nr:toll/interleukin-1 receptor domain-containing protein [Verrucomicrobiota bacterium]